MTDESVDVLTLEEHELKSKLKKAGVLKKFKNGELKGVAKNGGVAIVCADGDIDKRNHHKKEVSSRDHCVALFAGVLVLMEDYGGFNESDARFVVENIRFGMAAKKTNTVFAYFHYPCAAAKHYNHTFEDILRMIAKSKDALVLFGFKKTFILLHVKRLKRDGSVKQNTYLVDTDLLKKFIEEGGLD